MSFTTYINKIERGLKMVRLTITQAIEYLLDKVLDMLDMNVIDQKKAKEMSKDITALESNPLELKARLEKKTNSQFYCSYRSFAV